jgi:hypothetical protein
MDGKHVCLPKTSISKNKMKQNDENLSELEVVLVQVARKTFLQENEFGHIFLNSQPFLMNQESN